MRGSFGPVTASRRVIVVTDDDTTFSQLDAALADDDTTLRHVRAGKRLRSAVAEEQPDLVVCDLQIGSMGGVAATLDLRAEEGAGRLPRVPIVLLCDREADRFLAERSGADNWLMKPLEPLELRRIVESLSA